MAIERAGELVEDGTLPPTALAEAIALGGTYQARRVTEGRPYRLSLSRAELLDVLGRTGWDVHRAAATLQVGRTTLFKQLKAFGISLRTKPKFTSSPEVTGLS
jgi:transcriptional regulator of acetoin/glycerol metabolism